MLTLLLICMLTLTFNIQLFGTVSPVSGSALLTESAAPYYVGSAISFSGAGSTQGFNGTVTVPLKNATLTIKNSTNTVVYQNTIVNSNASAYLWSWTPTQADTYYATLTVNLNPAGQTTPPKIPLVYTDGPYTKTVTIKPSTFIACWTASARWGGYTAATVGIGENQSADAYTFDENVTIYSIAVCDNKPMLGCLVSFQISAPNSSIFLLRTALTNASGIANITFRIPTEGVNNTWAAGKWCCFIKAYMCQEPYTDTLWFDVGYIVTVTNVVAPNVTLPRGTMSFTISWNNIAEAARNVTFVITVYDNNMEPIGCIIEQLSVAGGTFCCPATDSFTLSGITVPTWAKPGSCSVRVDLYNKLPTEGGSPWGPEVSVTFTITIIPAPPQASFAYRPLTPLVNQTVTFNASASSPGWNNIVWIAIANYTWKFGDGSVTTTTKSIITHKYNAAGTYEVNLTVTCKYDPVLAALGLLSNSTWQNITIYQHDVAVTSITPSATQAYPTWKVPLKINVTVTNKENFTESFPVTLYWNNTKVIGTETVTLSPQETETITYNWTIPIIPKAYPYPVYILSANVTLPNNINSGILIGGTVTVKWPGDCNGDGHVNGFDLYIMAVSWHHPKGTALYDPRADFLGDGTVNGYDLYWMAINWHKGPLPN